MKIRKAAISDAKLLFLWANDSSVRQNAIDSKQIEWEKHLVWFKNKLESNHAFLFIAEIDENPIGQIRFDFENNKYVIDYSIAKDKRGKGYGFQVLKEGMHELKKHASHLCTFLAFVKPDNTASKRVFEKMGFSNNSIILIEQTELIVYELTT